MGSSNLLSQSHVGVNPRGSTQTHQPCLYTNLSKLDVTCEKTNKIDIDRYFQLMKDELIKHESPTDLELGHGRGFVSRSMSGPGKIERSERKKKNSSSSRPKSTRKHSMDAHKALVGAEKEYSAERSTRGQFSWDLSGQIVEVGEHKDDRGLSKQKSWDLSSSKAKGVSRYHAFGHDEHLHRSHSDGDFSDTLNNNNSLAAVADHEHSKSSESFQSLNRRHMESAHGHACSVSEQNRRLRRKHYKKSRKSSTGSSGGGGKSPKANALSSGDDEDISLEEIFRRKLEIHETPASI